LFESQDQLMRRYVYLVQEPLKRNPDITLYHFVIRI